MSARTDNRTDGSMIDLLGNTVWVDATYGDDARGKAHRPDLPFATIGAAVAAAASGDTIWVTPGTYNERNLLKNGVNFYFMPGANVVYTGAGDGSIFSDSTDGTNGAVTSNILGYGIFRHQGTITTTATKDANVFRVSNASSNIYVEALEASTTVNPTGVSSAAVKVTNGAFAGYINLMSAVTSAAYLHGGGTSKVGGRFVSTKASTEAVTVSAAGFTLAFTTCELIPGAGASASIDAGTAQNVKIYSNMVSPTAKGANITFTVGAFTADADVT